MTSLFRWAAAATIMSALALPCVAHADGWTISSPLDTTLSTTTAPTAIGRFYVTPEVGWQGQNMPTFHIGGAAFGDGHPFYSTNLTLTGAEGGLALGYLLPGDPLGGHNSRVALSFNIYSLTAGSSQAFASPSPATQWDYVGGGPSATTGGVYGASVRDSLNGGEVALSTAVDYPLTANFTITPGIALFGGWSHLGIDYSDLEACTGSTCFVDTQTHRVSTAEVGGTVSIGSRLVVTPAMSVLLGGGVGLVYNDSHLNSSDCFDENELVAGCQSSFGGSPVTASSASASRNVFAYRLMGQTGLRYLLGPAEINLIGGVRYGPTATINNPSVAGQAVYLTSTQQVGYTVLLSVRVPFGGWPSTP